MWNEISFYIQQGVRHIFDLTALDHLLFICSFCLPFQANQWKKILGLVTAFTLGHSLSLILATYNIIGLPTNIIETSILLSIIVSCIITFSKLFSKETPKAKTVITYFVLLVFGLIHGLGFSNFLTLMMFSSQNQLPSILGFNIGIELAQASIVAIYLLLFYLIKKLTGRIRLIKIIANTLILGYTIYLLLT